MPPESEFRSHPLQMDGNLYHSLANSVQWHDHGKGRHGAVLVDPDDVRGIPIVRTTTRYSIPAQRFREVHSRLATQVQAAASLPDVSFNNALIEKYTNQYARMGMHCDQALDLKAESSVAIFSCYEYPDQVVEPRKLIIEPKDASQGQGFTIPMLHNSMVTFTLDTNRRFRHKIVLDRSSNPPENTWLGVTFRTSKTFVRAEQDQVVFEDGTPLRLCNGKEQHRFFTLRGRENKETDFQYPNLRFTFSESDLLPVDGS